jgi:hypothetical protein
VEYGEMKIFRFNFSSIILGDIKLMLEMFLLTAVICCLATPSVSWVELKATQAATDFKPMKLLKRLM